MQKPRFSSEFTQIASAHQCETYSKHLKIVAQLLLDFRSKIFILKP